jgi:PPIC-type PPIASE domain/SurA-like N-terminal domain
VSRRAAQAWLALGAVAGIALAAVSLVRGPDDGGAAPAGAVAVVNGRPISREAFARFVGTAAREQGGLDLDVTAERRLLQRMIDEELLLQAGLRLDLPRREPTARRAIVAAVIDSLTAGDGEMPPSDAELESFLATDAAEFARPGPVRVQGAWVPVVERSEVAAYQRASRLAERVRAGEDWDAVAAELGTPPDPPLPEEPVEMAALAERLGNRSAEALLALAPGEVSSPLRGPDGYWVLRLVEREPDRVPALAEIRDRVLAAWQRSVQAARLEDELTQLRDGAEIRILDPELAGP